MEISIDNFITNLIELMKLGVHINHDKLADIEGASCIKFCKKLQGLNSSSSDDVKFIKVIIKRFNLLIKVDENGNPVDVNDKESQKNILNYKAPSSFYENDIEGITKTWKKHKNCIAKNIPLTLFLRDSPIRNYIWNVIKIVFYLSEGILSHDKYEDVYSDAVNNINSIVDENNKFNELLDVNRAIATDKFLKEKLSCISKDDTQSARNMLISDLESKGVILSPIIIKVIDMITDVIENGGLDASGGDIMGKITNIAQGIARSLVDDGDNLSEGDVSGLMKVFEFFKNGSSFGIPPELMSMMGSFMSMKESPPENMEAMMNMNNSEIISMLSKCEGLNEE